MIRTGGLDDGAHPVPVGDGVAREVEDDRGPELQQIDRERCDDAANLPGGDEILLNVFNRVSKLRHPLVFAEQDRRRGHRDLSRQRRFPGSGLSGDKVQRGHSPILSVRTNGWRRWTELRRYRRMASRPASLSSAEKTSVA